MLAQEVERVGAVIRAIDFHGALLNFVETRDELYQRCFTAAGKANERNLLPGRNMQINPFQYGLLRAVAEDDVFKANIALQPGWPGIGNLALQHFGSLIQNFLNAFRARGSSAVKGC